MAKKKEFDIAMYCGKLIGKKVKYYYPWKDNRDPALFHGRIVRVRLEILEEETEYMTLRSPNTTMFDNGEVELFE